MEVTRRLRSETDPALRDVPIVLITAQSGPENRADARGRSRFRHRRPRRGVFNDRALRLYRPSHDFGRICRRVLILLGCLALEQHVHLRFRWHAVQKEPRLSCRDRARADAEPLTHRAWEDSQVRTPFENRTAQTRTATTMEPTSASHSVYGAVSGISLPNDSRIAPPIRTSLCHLPVRDCFVQKNWDNCGAWGRKLLKSHQV
jgi:hypothetical protein